MRDQRVAAGAAELDDVGPAAVGGDGIDVGEVDDVAFVAAHEKRGIKARFDVGEGIAGDIAAVVYGVEDGGALLALHEENVLHVDNAHAVAVLEQDAAGLRARLDGFGALRRVFPRPEHGLGALERGERALGLEGLEQIIERIDLERVGHVFVVRGGEDEDGMRVAVLQLAGAVHA